MYYQLKLGNLMALFVAAGTGWLMWRLRPEVGQAITCIARIGPGNPPAVRLEGCIALAVIVLGIVSVARLVRAERTNDK